jgi:hypothetical protein
MNRQDFNDWETRVRNRADQLWQEAGRPDGGKGRYMDQARELLAMEEVTLPTLDPDAAPVVEEAALQRNLGEFPTLVDQGEEATFPDDHAGEPRLSDGDASDTGGVLPQEDQPNRDLPDATLAEGDVTSSSLNATDGPQTPDMNDDGVPDPSDVDADAKGEMPEGDEYVEAEYDPEVEQDKESLDSSGSLPV